MCDVRICLCWSVKALMEAHSHTRTCEQPLKEKQIFARRLRIFGAFFVATATATVACNSPAVQHPRKMG